MNLPKEVFLLHYPVYVIASIATQWKCKYINQLKILNCFVAIAIKNWILSYKNVGFP